MVCNMLFHTSCEKTVSSMLYNSGVKSKDHETDAIIALKDLLGIKISRFGLFVRGLFLKFWESPCLLNMTSYTEVYDTQAYFDSLFLEVLGNSICLSLVIRVLLTYFEVLIS